MAGKTVTSNGIPRHRYEHKKRSMKIDVQASESVPGNESRWVSNQLKSLLLGTWQDGEERRICKYFSHETKYKDTNRKEEQCGALVMPMKHMTEYLTFSLTLGLQAVCAIMQSISCFHCSTLLIFEEACRFLGLVVRSSINWRAIQRSGAAGVTL